MDSDFIYIVGLIMLDKYTGNLGEVSLEKSLLVFLHNGKAPSQSWTSIITICYRQELLIDT